MSGVTIVVTPGDIIAGLLVGFIALLALWAWIESRFRR